MPGIYLHVPFCRSKCRYCGFVSYPYEKDAAARYRGAVEMEMDAAAVNCRRDSFDSVYVGGGTPTCLVQEDLLSLLGRIRPRFHVSPAAEITVEANPGTVDAEYLHTLRREGVNRLSLGVQTFDEELLLLLGRPVRPAVVRRTVRESRAAGFDNLSLDLIFGLPGQSPASFRQTLDQALELEPEHISVYGLELVPGTPLFRAVQEGGLDPCPEEDDLEMYWEAIHTLTRAGFHHYEISNFARPGRECRHNLLYWRNGDYLGFGPAAAAHWRGVRRSNPDSMEAYLRGEGIVEEGEDPAREMTDTVLMGLRLLAGLDLAGFACRFGVSLESVYGEALAWVQAQGLAEIKKGCLRLTTKGLPLANEVFRAFV